MGWVCLNFTVISFQLYVLCCDISSVLWYRLGLAGNGDKRVRTVYRSLNHSVKQISYLRNSKFV